MSRSSAVVRLLVVLTVFGAAVPYAALAAPATLTASGGTTSPGETVTVSFTLENTGSEASAYILDASSLPDDFSIESRDDDGGTWKGSENSWLWQTVEAGNTVEPSLTISVPSDANGEYSVDAEAKDSDGVQDTATATITVEGGGGDGDAEPVAEYESLSVSPTDGEAPLTVTASATVTNTGGEGSITVPLRVDGDRVAARNVTLGADESTTVEFDRTFESSGEYDVTIGDLSPQTVSVGGGSNAAPSASFSVSDTEPEAGTSVEFTSESSDSDGEVVSVEWDVDGDGSYEKTGSSISHTYEDEGDRTVTLRIEDDDGATATASETVSVQPESTQDLSASISGPDSVTEGGAATFSVDVNGASGGVDSRRWDLDDDGDFDDATGSEVSPTFEETGTTAVSVEVTDGDGRTDTATKTVEVDEPAAVNISYAVSETELEPGESLTVDANVINSGEESATRTIDVTVDGETVRSEQVSVGGGETVSLSFQFSLDEGEHEVTVGDNDPTTVEVTDDGTATFTPTDEPTATPTKTPTPTPTDEPTPTATNRQTPTAEATDSTEARTSETTQATATAATTAAPTNEDDGAETVVIERPTPGFGVPVAVAALVIVGLLSRRRE